jgi:hypothetical protein
MKIEKTRLEIPPLLLEGDQPSTVISAPVVPAPEPSPRFDPPLPEPKIEIPAPAAATAVQVSPVAAPVPAEAAPPAPVEVPDPPPAPAPAAFEPESAALPESYGTGKLYLIPRDPHWLYAHWDIPSEQQRQYNQLSASNHLLVRVQSDAAEAPAKEIHVHPESRHWFVHVDAAATAYGAQLGYYQADGQWQTVASASPASTPPEMASPNKAVQFATIDVSSAPPAQPEPFAAGSLPHLPAAQSLPPPAESQPPLTSARPPTILAGQYTTAPRALELLRPHRVGWIPAFEAGLAFPELEARPGLAAGRGPSEGAQLQVPNVELAAQPPELATSDFAGFWTPEKEQALAALLGVRRQTIDSLTLAEWLGETPAISSPLDNPPAAPRDFWLNVNAEIVVYGAAEPDATVLVAGQAVQLRDDGTFSLRVALPDGEHALPVVAVSAQGDLRHAQLHFSRRTQTGDAP